MGTQYSEPADIKVYVKGEGVVVKLKALIAISKETKKVVGIGEEVVKIAAEQGDKYDIISPFHQGRVVDYHCARMILQYALGKAGKKLSMFRLTYLAVCVPDNFNEIDKKAYEDALIQSGARQVYICNEPFDSVIQSLDQPHMNRVKYVIHITKDQPELYIKEALSEVIEAARKQGFDKEWVKKLLEESY